MRHYFLAIGVLLFAAAPALAQKIGYVDSQKILTQTPDFQQAQSKLDKEVEDWQSQASAMNDEVDSLKREQQKNSLVWSQAKKKEADDRLKAKQDTLQQYLDTTFGPNGKAEKRNLELTKPIKDKVIGIIKKIAIENDFDMIFDAANSGIAYAKEGLDITDQVITELGKEK